MEVRLQYETVAQCHPADVWHLFNAIEEWHKWSGVFGHAGWVHGGPWQEGSRFFLELLSPRRVDLEVIVAAASPDQEVVMLLHGADVANQQWVRFSAIGQDQTLLRLEDLFMGTPGIETLRMQQAFLEMYARWFDGLKAEAEKHCLLVAL